ncbi:MAG: hypothetical protein ACOCUD_03640 [Bacillota bacterium]
MLNRKFFKTTSIIIILMLFIFCSLSLEAEEQKTPKEFVEYIYANYADENFKEIYANFADELKALITEEEYIESQKKNFNKYKLEYSNIKVDDLKELNYEEFKNEFSFLEAEGDFYSFKVSYLMEFNRFGDREEETEKRVYLRRNNSETNSKEFQLFWDPEPILKNEDAESGN